MTPLTRRIKRPNVFRPQIAWLPGQLRERYGFPALPTTSAWGIVIPELGGGHSASDLGAYCARVGIPVPPVHTVGANHYSGDPNSADGEVALDVQVVAG